MFTKKDTTTVTKSDFKLPTLSHSDSGIGHGVRGAVVYENEKSGQRMGMNFEEASIGVAWTSKKGNIRFFIAHKGAVAIIIALILSFTLIITSWITSHSDNTEKNNIFELIHDLIDKIPDSKDVTLETTETEEAAYEVIISAEPKDYSVVSFTSDDGFIFPNSDKVLLTNADVADLMESCTTEEVKKKVIQWAINEMEARYGYDFTGNEEYKEFIEKFDWYKAVYQSGKGHQNFEGVEKKNFQLLVEYRNEHF